MEREKQIPSDVAQKVVDLLYEAIGCNINVMGENGEIIATKQKQRLGSFHEGGRRVVRAFRDFYQLNVSDEALKMSSGFGGGLGHAGCMCGTLSGATMVLGMLQGRNKPRPHL
ncbi:hypothetical protein SPACI_039900 [Sporomusa acidovorans DSM 3132]|uniref:Uncharacterized protein n=1 Tax=Sporomusa acidovorans (strain ATCC 49682 / DSM 3132 / Mol) TaxID=1123286 RepID=A0ABZ3J669_SPOA4|nr:carbohydrate diacid transcriptional activator CdaR [Sporomusa acidovorans DSM 3132]SDE36498.1 C_GCAxxG_C_C family probable redox protein [Sporomusa acidovorans]